MSYIQNPLSVSGVTGITGGWTGSALNTIGYTSIRATWVSDQDTTLNIRQGTDNTTSLFTDTYNGTANVPTTVTTDIVAKFANVDVEFVSNPSTFELQTFFFKLGRGPTGPTGPGAIATVHTITCTGNTGLVEIIPPAGTILYITGNVLSDADPPVPAGESLLIQFNGDSGSNYLWAEIYGNGALASSAFSGVVSGIRIGSVGCTGTDSFAGFSAEISNYGNSTMNKTVSSTSCDFQSQYMIQFSGSWYDVSPVTSIQLVMETGSNFRDGSIINYYAV